MTSQTVHSDQQYSPKAIALAVIGAALAVLLGFGIAALTLDSTTTLPATDSVVVPGGGGGTGGGTDAYTNPDRELRELMHRRCAERIGC